MSDQELSSRFEFGKDSQAKRDWKTDDLSWKTLASSVVVTVCLAIVLTPLLFFLIPLVALFGIYAAFDLGQSAGTSEPQPLEGAGYVCFDRDDTAQKVQMRIGQILLACLPALFFLMIFAAGVVLYHDLFRGQSRDEALMSLLTPLGMAGLLSLIPIFQLYRLAGVRRELRRGRAGRLLLSQWPLRGGQSLVIEFRRHFAKGEPPATWAATCVIERVSLLVKLGRRAQAWEVLHEIALDPGHFAQKDRNVWARWAIALPAIEPDPLHLYRLRLVITAPELDSVFTLDIAQDPPSDTPAKGRGALRLRDRQSSD